MRCDAGWVLFRLKVPAHERLGEDQALLFDHGSAARQLELEHLFERLRVRLGEEAVIRPGLMESYLPERLAGWGRGCEGGGGGGSGGGGDCGCAASAAFAADAGGNAGDVRAIGRLDGSAEAVVVEGQGASHRACDWAGADRGRMVARA